MKLFDFQKYGAKEMDVPSGEVFIHNIQDDEIEGVNLDQYVGDRNVIIIGIPGAFTPTCTDKHLPGFVKYEQQFYEKNVDEIVCLSVNDPHVMMAFSDYVNQDGSRIVMASDPFGEVSEQIGTLTDMGLLGQRTKRFAAIVKNGKVFDMLIDERGLDVSTAENCLKNL